MKTMDFIIFIGIVLLIYSSVNYYIFARGNQALQSIPWLKTAYYIIFSFLFLAYFAHIFLVRKYPSNFSSIFTWTGSFWMGAMLYLFLSIVFIDLLRLVNHFLPFFPSLITENYQKVKLITGGVVVLSTIITLTAGYFNAVNPKLKELNIHIDKKVSGIKKLKIVAATDIHLGCIVNNHRISELAESINALNPDIVILAGDILDESIAPVLKFKSGEPLKNIKSKYGVYAITGNHEYIGGINEAAPYIQSLGIKLLRDSVALIDNAFYIIGREDRDSKRFKGIVRKNLNELMGNIDKTKPLILLDHQPLKLVDAENNDIDFQLSGHTHHGQLFPFNFVTKKVYELSWGYLKKGKTQYYVSCGYGTWGPPIRTGNTPELLLINMYFDGK
jgi:uncharacterized protein